MPDHVHLLVSLPPAAALADVVRVVKTSSSHWARQRLNRPFAWQGGYGAFSVSRANVPEVEAYIAGQAAHHRVVSFQEELLALLTSHGIAYDLRYLWEQQGSLQPRRGVGTCSPGGPRHFAAPGGAS